jgi:hypothetical protein
LNQCNVLIGPAINIPQTYSLFLRQLIEQTGFPTDTFDYRGITQSTNDLSRGPRQTPRRPQMVGGGVIAHVNGNHLIAHCSLSGIARPPSTAFGSLRTIAETFAVRLLYVDAEGPDIQRTELTSTCRPGTGIHRR